MVGLPEMPAPWSAMPEPVAASRGHLLLSGYPVPTTSMLSSVTAALGLEMVMIIDGGVARSATAVWS